MHHRWLAAIGTLLCCLSLQAQGGEDLRDAISRFESAWYNGRPAEARTQICRIYDLDSSQAYRFAEEAEQLFLSGSQHLEEETVDTLSGIYASAIRHDTLRRPRWLVARALLLNSHLPATDSRRQAALHDAFHRAPEQCPIPLMEAFLQDRFALCKRGRITPAMLMQDWVACDKALTRRQVLQPDEAQEAAQMQIWSMGRLLETLPDCNSLVRSARSYLANGITQPQAEGYYLLLHLRHCNATGLMDTLERRVVTPQAEPYWHRAAAQLSLNAELFPQAKAHLQQAMDVETNPLLKAGDLVVMARIEHALGSPELARQWLREASRLHPSWGEPYLRLADLYADGGGPQCKLTRFDRKAVHWASIELCTLAKNVDPSVEEDANRRIVMYMERMPTAEECSFRGLRPGDTYPLLCWMDITTTVKVK